MTEEVGLTEGVGLDVVVEDGVTLGVSACEDEEDDEGDPVSDAVGVGVNPVVQEGEIVAVTE